MEARAMKTKDMLEGKAALENFTRAMQTAFRVPKSAVIEPKRKPRAGRTTKAR
jgi:hypothetical protein